MMTWWTHGAKRIVHFCGHDQIHSKRQRTRRTSGCFEAVGIHRRIGIDANDTLFRRFRLDIVNVIRCVNTQQRFARH